ncbi:hypothetical protein HaLaN_12083 [Haematococcus lacustris]|uniref:Uncharacterized protein n=1 Tax=Haematococcus lacustris TaxID=44745 RepID=A0A699Z9A8_HAELA|nr:hypothetical protein HaLaN_12083 [Haematococcus lacustris]
MRQRSCSAAVPLNWAAHPSDHMHPATTAGPSSAAHAGRRGQGSYVGAYSPSMCWHPCLTVVVLQGLFRGLKARCQMHNEGSRHNGRHGGQFGRLQGETQVLAHVS